MVRLSIDEILAKIEAEEVFHAVSSDYSLSLKIDEYVPYVCGAVHDGHNFRKELWDNCLHSGYDRWYEEDPETKNMVYTLPIVIAGCDSRFEYDLNRPPEEAVFETAWGKELWKEPLPEAMKLRSQQKHTNFYKIVHALISKVESKFGACIIYDMHSYNWKRWDRAVPTWNLGTSNVDNERFNDIIKSWQKSLSEIKLPHNIKSDSLINNTFYGNGYFLKYITKSFQNTLVLATEIAKIYCDEHSRVIYPEVVAAVEEQLKDKIKEHALNFYKTYGHK